MAQLGCGVTQKGAAWPVRMPRDSLGCGVDQYCEAWLRQQHCRLVVRQARVRISARHPRRGHRRAIHINIVCVLD